MTRRNARRHVALFEHGLARRGVEDQMLRAEIGERVGRGVRRKRELEFSVLVELGGDGGRGASRASRDQSPWTGSCSARRRPDTPGTGRRSCRSSSATPHLPVEENVRAAVGERLVLNDEPRARRRAQTAGALFIEATVHCRSGRSPRRDGSRGCARSSPAAGLEDMEQASARGKSTTCGSGKTEGFRGREKAARSLGKPRLDPSATCFELSYPRSRAPYTGRPLMGRTSRSRCRSSRRARRAPHRPPTPPRPRCS